MISVSHEVTYNTIDRNNAPSAIVKSGEIVEIHTQLNGGDWLKQKDDLWDPTKSKGPNLAVVIEVEGAKENDGLKVEILDIVPESLGYTGFAGWRTKLPSQIWPEAANWDVVTKTVEIKSDYIQWSKQLQLPIQPMIGTIATASKNEVQSNYYAYHNGGNMDVQEICKGTTLYLPVEVDGALLHVGDCHAIMGDGEIPHGGGIECRAKVVLRVTVEKEYKAKSWLRLENEEYIMTIANENKMKQSFIQATRELIYWMIEDYHFTPQEAYLLLGQVLEARCTMLHGDDGPFSPYIAKVKKKYLKAERK